MVVTSLLVQAMADHLLDLLVDLVDKLMDMLHVVPREASEALAMAALELPSSTWTK